jgi:hypothetical protein
MYFALIAAGWVVAAAGALALLADGSVYAASVLTGAPFTPQGRLGTIVLEAPALVLAGTGAGPIPVLVAFDAVYAAVPLIALGICWWLVHTSGFGSLFRWPALAISIGLMPGAVFQINEAMIVGALGWALLLGAAVPRSAVQTLVVVILGAFVVLLHPIGVVFVLGAFLFAGRRRRSGAGHWAFQAWLLALAVVGMLSPVLAGSAHVQQVLSPIALVGALSEAFLLGLLTLALLSIGVRATRAPDGQTVVATGVLAVVAVAVAAATLVESAEGGWPMLLSFRYWVLPVTVRLAAGLWLESAPHAAAMPRALARRSVALLRFMAGISLLVAIFQVGKWQIELAEIRSMAPEAACPTSAPALRLLDGYSWTMPYVFASARLLLGEATNGTVTANHFTVNCG